MQQHVTVKYGLDNIQKTYDVPVTIGQLRADRSVKAGLGYGDNVRFLLNGVELGDDAVVPNGATVVVETKANTKAVLV